ncbi:hypothetical protein GLAREA_00214 [Glarea lozoyensis ATCC 20868]|uniref:Uncharacterized protein n=1 Tax=Glarea lozoyensis (strain ATCC 20868 / MF5171) TaxID=1116229 RepID=S3DAP5_GLAL2|nr:uncharacterized protein GLAREA_00214 [Glarea lozoyensis ATCC 20868]EPE29056.1 hypothetical protein GLAREA_00214 [Glarea lozoyensis ATCC 20868]
MPSPKHQKDPTTIEIWRQEVSACLHSDSTPSVPTTNTYTSPPPNPATRPSTLWKKMKYLRLFDYAPKPVAEVAPITTEMYSSSTDQERSPTTDRGHVVRDDESIDFHSQHSDILDGLREKAERLERARRLLDGGAKGDGKRIA